MAATSTHDAALRVAAVSLRFEGGVGEHAGHLDEMGPFCAPAPTDAEVRVALRPGCPGPDDGGWDFRFQREYVDFRASTGRRRVQAFTDGTRGSFHAVVELALQAALLPLGGCLVHAAGGVVGGAAWVLPGTSGAGKSTSARGGFDQVLSDERVALRRRDGGFEVYGTPFWSEGRELPLATGHAPLGVLARLVKSDATDVGDLADADAVDALLRCIVLYEDDPAARHAVFELACDAVEAARCIDLSFPKGRPWVSDAITALSRLPSRRPPSRTSRSPSTGT